MSVISVVVPAHNEARVIGRLLDKLLSSAQPGEFEVVVVANGCTDNTADIAASFGSSVQVLSLPVASKAEALAVGNHAASVFPRLYVDADVELGAEDVRALAAALRRPGVLGAGPEVTYTMAARPWPIRWYYDVWTRLPEVQRGLFGRGVVGVSAAGFAHIADRPLVLADDLATSLAFSAEERVVVPGARVTVHPPGSFADLIRARTRAAMGVNQIETLAAAHPSTARTRPADLLDIAAHQPRLAPRVAFFLVVALIARTRARRVAAQRGYSQWLRDESSRGGPVKSTDAELPRVQLGNLRLDPLTEREVITTVRKAWDRRSGGSIFTVNTDIARAATHQTALADLLAAGSLVVADGMPLVWAARIGGDALPERVTGSSLVLSLSEAAAADGRTLFILGGPDGVPERAARALCARSAGLRVVGTASPPPGFDRTDEGMRQAVDAVVAAAPDLVLVGLGFPKQERLIEQCRQQLPAAWYLACGGGISMAAGEFRRASPLVQRIGLEWMHRLVLEPRRLARRYLHDDLPFAVTLLGGAVRHRMTRRPRRIAE
jgi:N-acetylglucosaminyldiphosphoundecaprenol N-acetyl-beta-D-mannosaminyltransferase